MYVLNFEPSSYLTSDTIKKKPYQNFVNVYAVILFFTTFIPEVKLMWHKYVNIVKCIKLIIV